MNKFNGNVRTLLLALALIAVSVETAAAQTGTVTDTRDGQTYKTVMIGTQTWMAENLNYLVKKGSWCYENNADSCEKYGRLYDWDTAKKACPAGWHLPSRQEWRTLVTTAGGPESAGMKLKAKRVRNQNGYGTDDYGFSALLGGYRTRHYVDNVNYVNDFIFAGEYGYWWSSKVETVGNAYYRAMDADYDYASEGSDNQIFGFSVRCVQN
jgi:uncharacterized protein (TIGR02145 family)